MSGIKTNPNAFGGSFNYDSRTGLGYGQVTNNGLGSEWDMGDALSSQRGEWDDASSISCDCDDVCDCLDTIAKDFQNMSPTSGFQFNKDSGSGQSSRDPFSYNPLSNTSAYLGASHKRDNTGLLREYISLLITENRPHMGGMTAVRSSGKNKAMYKKDTANSLSGYGMGGKGSYGISYKGYTQNGTEDGTPNIHDMSPYVKKGKATTDGAEVVYDSDQETDWHDDYSTGDSLALAISDEEQGKASFEKHALTNGNFK